MKKVITILFLILALFSCSKKEEITGKEIVNSGSQFVQTGVINQTGSLVQTGVLINNGAVKTSSGEYKENINLKKYFDKNMNFSFYYPDNWKVKSEERVLKGKSGKDLKVQNLFIETDDFEVIGPNGKQKSNINIDLFAYKVNDFDENSYGMFFGDEKSKTITNENGEKLFFHIYIGYLVDSVTTEETKGEWIEKMHNDFEFYNDKYSKLIDEMLNSFVIGDGNYNGTTFNENFIEKVVSKLNEETDKNLKNNDKFLTDGDYKVEYIQNSNDKYKSTINVSGNGKRLSFLPNKNLGKGNDNEYFAYFDGFSPNKYYLLYTNWVEGYGTFKKYLVDTKTGKEILSISNAINTAWTKDNKQFIFSSENSGISITKKGDFPNFINIGGKMSFPNFYVDEYYIYGIGFEGISGSPKFLKIYDLTTLGQIFSRELKD